MTSWEGLVSLPDGYRRYVKRFGNGAEVLLALHGGPGADSRGFERLSELADDGFQVVFYDQLGGGRSDRPADPTLWRVETFVEEFKWMVEIMGLDAVHLLGQSWGGMLALECTLRHPTLVRSLLLCDTMASVQAAVGGFEEILASASREARAAVASGTNFDPNVASSANSALLDLYATHVRRSYPFDIARSRAEFLTRVVPLLEDLGPAYETMWGLNEFAPSGLLRDWDVSGRLPEIMQSVLVMSGLHDELTLSCHQQILDGLQTAEWVVLGQSSHCIFMERETDVALDVIRGFISRVATTAAQA